MTISVTDGLALASGVYDLRVENPHGAEAVSAGALAVVDKPSVSAVVPAITCIAQSRTVIVTGQEILRIADAGFDPSFSLDWPILKKKSFSTDLF